MSAPQLTAFRLLSGAHVGPDFTQDPAEISSPTPDDPGRVLLSFPPRQFKAVVSGSAPEPGQSNVVYSPANLSEKFNQPRSDRFTALGDAPKEVQARFEEAFNSGRLDPRQSGAASARPRRLTLSAPAPAPTPTAKTAAKKEAPVAEVKDPHDLSPGGTEDDLHELTVSDLRELAADEEIELPHRASKDELVSAIKKARKAK